MGKMKDNSKKLLPARSSRGTRINKLIGEEAEADEAFWGQDAWGDEEEDEDYSTEEEEEDIVDVDFDDEEIPDEDVHDEDEDKKAKRRSNKVSQRRSVYKEPKKNTAIKRIKTPVATTDIPSGTLKKQVVPFTYEAPKVRQSTALKSSQSNELRQKYTEEARTAAKARKSLQQQHQQQQQQQLRFTQAELLAEAVRTEMENTRSLNRLEQLEEEKKTENLTPKAPFTGEIVRYHSCLGRPKTITFLNTDHFPAIFNQTKPKKPHHHHHHKHKPPHHDHHHHQPQQ